MFCSNKDIFCSDKEFFAPTKTFFAPTKIFLLWRLPFLRLVLQPSRHFFVISTFLDFKSTVTQTNNEKKQWSQQKQTNKENRPLLSSPPLSSRHLTFPPCQWLGLCYKSNHASEKYSRAPTAFSQLAFPTPGVQHCLSLSLHITPPTQ